MKKLLQTCFTLGLLFFGNFLFGQNLDFTIKFNTYTSEYEVYARPDFTESTFFVAGGTQLSIAVPASVGDAPFVVSSVSGGPWSDNSRVFAPAANANYDFHSIASDGISLANFASGVEELLFTFKLPLGGCVEGVRLFENTSDPQPSDAGMFNTDFNNFFGDAFVLFSNYYQVNYNNNGTLCSDPMLVPIPLTVEMDSSGVVCMNVLDANQLDSFTVNTCGATNGTPNATINGSVVCVAYQPNNGYVGTDSVCVYVCDQTGNCDTTVIPITVVAPPLVTTVPEPPVVYPSPITVSQDSTIALCVPVLDPNAGSTFSPTLCGVPNGTATPSIDNGKLCLNYTPDTGFSGDTEICVVVCDQTGLCDTVTFPVTVFPLPLQADSNQAPIVTFPAVVTPEDTPISTCGTIADANTTDTYTATICATPTNVTATATIDNTNNQVCVNVTPNLHFNGHDVVCLSVCDQNGKCDTIQVPVTVTPVNDKPIAVLDRDTTDEDVLIVFDVQGNDIEIDNDPLTTTVIGNSTQGSTPTVVNDSISYLPPLNFYGIDTITYQICDNGTPQLCDTALAIIQVGPINDVPVAMGDTVNVNEDEFVTVMVQMDDEDVDMDDLTTRVIVDPTHGTYSIISMDSIQYKADTNYMGMDMLMYEICDNGLSPQLCDTATVYINIIPVNDKPIALNDSAIVTMNINNNIFPVEINDSDIEDSLLYLTPLSSSRGATLSAVNDTLLRYDPPLNYSGYDTVMYQICDHDTPNLCDTATVIVFVKPDGDNDGIANVDDLDDDNDGIPDAIEGYGDADGDGIPNNFDLDSDNDGIQDILEAGGADVNGDGRIDIAGSDFDAADADNDGLMDIIDAGSGVNDTLSNLTNGSIYTDFPNNAIDTDRDGLPDYLDVDADNDGLPDLIEAGGVDTDGDGRIDTPIDNDADGWADIYDGDYDAILSNGTDNPQGVGAAMGPLMVTVGDANADGTPGTAGNGGFSGGDFDGDLVPDFRDLDSDNDGLPDLIEAGGTDIEGDGIVDDFVDADNDGYDDNYDTDDDGLFGRDDPLTEPLVTTDPDGTGTDEDGRPTDFDNNGTAIKGITADIDSDGHPDYKDLDADNDGIPDLIEMGGTDVNGDGEIDNFVDADGDGFDDRYDTNDNQTVGTNDGTGTALVSTDPEGSTDDGRPEDNDNDGTAYNGVTADIDQDGLPDSEDLDADNDGLPDLMEMGGTDTDGNGIIDDFVDADGDGFDDTYDAEDNTTSTANDGGDPLITTDPEGTTNDGRPEDDDADGTPYNGVTADVDNDGFPDSEDLDADNDGLPDLIEMGGTDTDGNGIIDDFNDTNNDGFDDTYTSNPLTTTDPEGSTDDGRPEDDDADGTAINGPTADVDMDGLPDSEDVDADNDGLPDLIEMGGTDTDGNGRIDDFVDANNDGFDDTYTTNPLTTTDPEGSTDDGRPEDDDADGTTVNGITADIDSDGFPDSEDLDADQDGLPDLIEMGGTDTDGNGVIDDFNDTNNDGFDDTYTTDPLITTDPEGSTDDGRPEDDDNDNTPYNGGTADIDMDGFPDSEDLDADNDGIPDLIEMDGVDTDENGIIDNFTDTNNDGFDDAHTTTPLITTDPEGSTDDGRPEDDDSDGTPYNAPEADVDNDGIPNSEDLDTDNDGISDVVENGHGDLDTNNDGTIDPADDNYADTDMDGIPDPIDEAPNDYGDDVAPEVDTDQDETPDYKDVDADGDGINDVDEIGLGDLDTDDDGSIDETDADQDGIADTPDSNDDDADNQDFGGLATPTTDDWLNRSIRLVRVDPIKEIVIIKNFSDVAVDISGYRLCSESTYTTDLTSQTIIAGDFTLAADEEVTIKLDEISLTDAAADLALYITGTTNFGDTVALQDFTQWGSGGHGRESLAVDKGIWETNTYVSPNELPYFYYTGTGIEDGALFWKGHLIATLTPEGEPKQICADTTWTLNHPITASDCGGNTSGTATGAGGTYTIDATTGCINYVAPTDAAITSDTVCIVICDTMGLCDTSYAIFPIDTVDVAYPPNPLDPEEERTVCVDTSWVVKGPINVTDCNDTNSGNATPNGGAYTVDATTGCVTYTAPANATTAFDTVCIIVCDDFGICDTSDVVFPLDTSDVEYPVTPVDVLDSIIVCVDTSWATGPVASITDCDNANTGSATPNGGTYIVDPATGCVQYTAPAGPVVTSQDTVCLIVCDVNGVCDTSIMVFPIDTIDVVYPITPVDPGETHEVCPDTAWVTDSPLISSNCNGTSTGAATPNGGAYSIDALTGCVTYTYPVGQLTTLSDTVCIVTCDPNGICDTSIAVFPLDTIDIKFPPIAVDPTAMPTVCVDTSWVANGPLTASDCAGNTSGISPSNGGTYTIDPTTGCVTYTPPSTPLNTSHDTVCVVICDITNVCDTSIIVFPLDTIDQAMPIIPVVPGDTSMVCVDTSWITQMPITATDCNGQPFGNAMGVMGEYSVDVTTGCITYIAPESMIDVAGDTICMILCDANGVCDTSEVVFLFDMDGDYVADVHDYDDDNDGIPDAIEGMVDTDGDGIYDQFDLDSDNDGIQDVIEAGGVDNNGDGRIDINGINWNVADADNDGLLDVIDSGSGPNDTLSNLTNGSIYTNFPTTAIDTDGDGIPDFRDIDSDNDGITDLIEAGGADENGDGRVDIFADSDADGWSNYYDGDNDVLLFNGVNNPQDLTNGTGPLMTTAPDTNADGTPGTNGNGGFNGGDFDGDTIPDFRDLDSDNDGQPDLIEVGGTDTNGDGQIDDFNDADQDGYDDRYDTDDDGIAGIEDPLTEPLITTDPDGSGVDENGRPTDTDNNVVTYNGQTVDIDGDGNPDHLDLDADNDGTPDLIEMGGTDINGDGIIDDFNDVDGDGFDDNYDPSEGGTVLVSTDPEGTTDDGRPEDTDNDGTAYNGETADVDSDGIPDAEDLDSDNDGIPDLIEMGGTDTDGNGVIDDFNDLDGDGFDDTYDADNNATPTDNDGGTPLVTTDPEGTTNDGRPEDTDNDGTAYNGPTADVDNDGIMDSEDVDADNDGITDLIEVGGTDTDGDGQIDDFNDADNDGFDDTYSPATSGLPLISTDSEGTTDDGRPEDDDNDGTAYNSDAVDTDKDDVIDSEDLDSDNDGLPDLIETGGTDTDGDGQIDNPIDADKDGYDDRYDTNDNTIPGTNDGNGDPLVTTDAEGTTDDGRPEDVNNDGTVYDGETADVDSDGIPDMEDLDSDNDGIPDLIEMGGTDEDGNGIIDDFNDEDGDGFDDTYTTNPLITTDPEGTTNDGRPEDVDNNGTPYNGETADVDADGIPDSEDLDADNDGIPDLIEMGGTDEDGDGIIDDFNDTNGDGFDDTYSPATSGTPLITTDSEGTTEDGRPEDDDNNGTSYNSESADTDQDGVPDSEDLDTDNDGIPDIIETGGTDTDGDGKIDNPVDADNDGFDDRYDTEDNTTTTPNDGIGNPLVTTDAEGTTEDGRPEDTNNDGTIYNGETADIDGDGVPDMEDLDADNDGIPDLIEMGGTDEDGNGIIDDFNDTNGDGFDDTYTTDPLITTDSEGTTNDGRPEDDDNDGSAYNGDSADIDSDGVPDSEDLDADNDGVTDLIEMGGTDEDGDGVIDDFNDTNGDGFDDTYSPITSGTPLITTDPEGTTNDGRPEDEDNDGTPYNGESADVDSDGIPDSEDLDADNDGIPDLIEVGGTDVDGNGEIDEFNDEDGDGFDDTYDATENGTPLVFTDSEGTIDDGRPEDDDNDGTAFNGGNSVDTDGDGIIDSEDLDSDNDAIPDLIEVGGIDTDGDGQIDNLVDVDNDGFEDTYDSTESGTPLVVTDEEGTTDDGRPEDINEDNVIFYGVSVDVDKDGVPDFEDLDSDNDGIPDLIEMGSTDTDGDGVVDEFEDIDNNGFDDTYSPQIGGIPCCWVVISTPNFPTYVGFSADIDGDGILDSEDLDADNDGIPDLIEVGGTDSDGDGVIDNFNDVDGDGFDDNYDPDNNTTSVDENETDKPLITTDSEGTTDDGRPEDEDNDGTAYNGNTVDMDYDGIPDNEDLDADNDAIPDYVEVGGVDTDGNGMVDDFVDEDGDGFADTIDPDNNDTSEDEEDMSGVMINTESEGDTDDGRPEDMDFNGTVFEGTIADFDMDGIPNSEDLDTDNDGIPDIVESGNEAHDTNDNGVLDSGDENFADEDKDGVINVVDSNPSTFGDSNPPLEDIDNDGIPNVIDLDSDGDGTTDLDEAGWGPLDLNGDGVIDNNSDMDNDGIADVIDSNDDDADTDDLGGISNPITPIWELAATPTILDPCNCLANESALGAGDGQFSEEVTVTSQSGETWVITAVAGFYQNPTAPVFPPAANAGGPYPQVPYTVGTVMNETPLGDGRSRYSLQGMHVDAVGYSITVDNGLQALNMGHTCNYDNSCRVSITSTPDGTPGPPVPELDAHNFMIPTDNVARIDTMKSCEAGKNVFMDDGLIDGLYGDDSVRNNVLTICPTTRWQTVMVTFTDFDLADGDVLNVYEGVGTNTTNQIAVMRGTGVSQANGGWVMAHCDPDTNATGCLTFQFRTNGDNNKGRGWQANVTCNDRGIQLTPPNDLSAKLECDSSYAIFEIKPATISSNCGATVQDSQIVRVMNQHGMVCLDTCLADTDVVRDTFAIGSYLVEYKLKSDTTKTTQAIMNVQGASLVCNDEINVPLGASCSLMLTPDDLLESTCDTITDTMYYHITLKGLDKNGNEVVLATGGGKGGQYPMVTKDMIDQCGGSITAEIEKRYYEDLDLSICNNGPKSISCEVKVNLMDQSPPVFHNATSNDTFRLCSIDLTADALGIATPTAVDNCDTVKVEFAGATILNEGGACDTTRAMLNWTATDVCGNVAILNQSVVILRPDVADIVQAPDMVLSCGEDTDADLNNFAKTGMPRIKVGKVVNGVLQPTDTIDLDTATYVCGYILQKRDIQVPADCGIKVFRYWDILDWCDTKEGIVPVDTQFIELRDTLAPEFVATSLPTLNLELPHDACTLNLTKVDTPVATDNCSTPMVTMAKVSRIEDGTKWEIPTEELIGLNADSFEIEWVAADDCHVQTKTASLTQLVIITDKTKPAAICTDKINFSLARDAGNLHYRDFDAGSNDACGIAKYEVSRDEVNWDSVATFTCEDAHTEVKVFLRVTDVNGNQNTCWTLVNVEDKVAPICSDLPTMTETCDEVHIGNILPTTDTNEDGKMDETEWVDLTAAQVEEFNTKYENPNCSDNISCSELVIQQQYQFIQESCGQATIKRRFRAIDRDGEGMTSNWSKQTINIESKANWSITLPADWSGECGETIPDSEVTIVNGACDLMAYEVEEKVFTTIEDACLNVVRTFTIINWCKYQAGGETVTISRVEGEHGLVTVPQIITAKDYENVGKLEYVQILKLKDDTAPTITVLPVDSCLLGEACADTKRFAITATDCNEVATDNLTYKWTISTNDTQLAQGEGNTFNYPVASKVSYDVRWTVADNCGNTTWKDVSYEFWDCKKPVLYCLHGIAVDLMKDAGTIQIWAKDLDINSSDNCTPKDKLQYRIWHEALGEAPTTEEEVKALPEEITLNCAYLDNQAVNLYVIDEEGNWDFCSTYVNVQDNTGACENTESEEMAVVSGVIMDWKASSRVEGVMVKTATTTNTSKEMITEEDGQYDFELAMYDTYTITPEKDDQPLNGVSTFDLVLITKHILGQQPFTNPYQLIAADVNNSGTVTAFDMVQTRKLILAIDDNFTNNTSWRFVESSYDFTTDNPLTENFPEMATISDLDKDMEMDFVAIKIGDVNGNAKTNSLVAAEDRSTTEIFEITTEDKLLKAGESYSLTFQTEQLSKIQGYQFTLGYENLKVSNLKTGVAGVENFGLHLMDKGMITTSWNQELVGSQQLAVGSTQLTTLFTIEFVAEKDGQLSEQLSIIDRPTAIEAYNQSGEIMEVALTFTKPSIAETFDLFQNQPNPFHDKTMIGFYLPGDSEVQLVLRDEAGRVLKTIKEVRKAGSNTIQLDKEELTNGFIYYQLSTKYGTKVKKMVKLN